MVALADLEKLLSHRRTVMPGEVIFLEGQISDDAFVVLKGEVQIAITDSAHDQPLIINTMRAGDMFGEIGLLRDGYRTATATSAGGCELVVIDRSVFTDRLATADPFLRFVVDHLCRLILDADERIRRAS